MSTRRQRPHGDRNGERNNLAEGTYIGDTYVNPSEYAKCTRCGYERRIQSKRRVGTGMCQDCYYTEMLAAKLTPEPIDVPLVRVGLIWKQPKPAAPARPQRMSAEDMAWCERAATAWFWTDWERQNRRESLPLQTMHKARQMASLLSTGTQNTHVDNGVPVKRKEAFHEAEPAIERTA